MIEIKASRRYPNPPVALTAIARSPEAAFAVIYSLREEHHVYVRFQVRPKMGRKGGYTKWMPAAAYTLATLTADAQEQFEHGTVANGNEQSPHPNGGRL